MKDKFKVLIVGSPTVRTLIILDKLRERYGERLEVIQDDGKMDGSGMSFIAMDEFEQIKEAIVESYDPSKYERKPKLYWQKGRWQ